MKKMVMFTLICAVLLSLAADVRAKGKPGESRMFSEGVSYADRESHVEPWLRFYAGLGYYQWKMQYNTGLYGNSVFESTTQPFVLKQFDIRANLRILQFGLITLPTGSMTRSTRRGRPTRPRRPIRLPDSSRSLPGSGSVRWC
jgi:hypothetical protein